MQKQMGASVAANGMNRVTLAGPSASRLEDGNQQRGRSVEHDAAPP
jgi:hypothetical protein